MHSSEATRFRFANARVLRSARTFRRRQRSCAGKTASSLVLTVRREEWIFTYCWPENSGWMILALRRWHFNPTFILTNT
jgi:hypothetical protein